MDDTGHSGHERVDTWTTVQDSLFVGRSRGSYDCAMRSLTEPRVLSSSLRV